MKLVFVYILIALTTRNIVGKSQTLSSREAESFRDVLTTNGYILECSARTVVICLGMCLSHLRCMSFFYNADNTRCVLHKTVLLYPSSLAVSIGFRYYHIYDNDVCQWHFGYMYNRGADLCFSFYRSDDIDFVRMKSHCVGTGGELIKIDTANKQDFVAAFLAQDTTEIICIQGSDFISPGTWRFDDNSMMSYLNWNTGAGQPDGSDEHNIIMRKSFSYQWHDAEAVYPTFNSAYLCSK